jgi:hypothetical protein
MSQPPKASARNFGVVSRHRPTGLLPSLTRCYSETGMELLRKFRSLSPGERSLLLHTVLLVAFLRVALCLLPFGRVNDYLARRAKRRPIRQDLATSRLVWAVRTAAARIPRATCLTQALAAKYQLERYGRSPQLHLGVAKENGRFLAHAWLECDGETVLGGEIADRYVPLVAVG